MDKAYLHITQEETIKELQQEFADKYPYLKIDFFKTNYNGSKTNKPGILFREDVKIKEMKPDLKPGELEISDSMTIDELETRLLENFGLASQVTRRSGNLWLDTSRSGHLTLKEQNEHGRAISPGHHPNDTPFFGEVPFGC